MGRRTREEAAKTRKRLLDVSAELFSVRGVDGVTLVEIGREAGFTKGALYRHFGGKAGLLLELMDYAVDIVDRIEESTLSGEGPPLERLSTMAREEISIFEESENARRLLSIFLDRRSLVEDERVLLAIEGMRERTLGRMEKALTEARGGGDISRSVNLRAAAESLRFLIFGLMERSLYSSNPFSPSSMVGPMLDLYFRGLVD
ncbi:MULTISPECIES: TetR/AcrR family transcriptional regulator [Dethiosulfovibrio]|jgi:TetR/AcrR family acrAB operon transcriptional repressor|uniref:TetR family transcriptional regulator n=2 Tax=Dethiosulfovibrio TaxID=47054 RepID=A0ABS9ETR2_9BACT|nr:MULTISPECIES: TetR family transcriptional regulator [Dethiosulfovibrio]MCF4115081.1 TetR family transcriptional regulator [Dethiosulfovibrio russensis]MCF4143477.1 TetR family transcriptional regulator [Dethiosulfovibrio marinus]MCF4145708.1 TetR family transcriptional regulator [Dethiosulfovibrio acidaminovorans]